MRFYSFGLWQVSLNAQPPQPQEHEDSPLFFFLISLTIMPITIAAIIRAIINVCGFIFMPPFYYFTAKRFSEIIPDSFLFFLTRSQMNATKTIDAATVPITLPEPVNHEPNW